MSRLSTGLGGTGQTLEGDLEQTSLTTESRWGNESVFCGKLCKTAVT
jgi:hypothetical protein